MSAKKHRWDVAPQRLQALYQTMSLIRHVETALTRLFANGEVPGFIHLSIGQEAVAAGIASALRPQDSLATTHRGHGHVLARGMDVEGFMKEIMGREGGLCKGRGGSMHVADLNLGILGANGIVGAGIPIALGSAMAHQARKTGGTGLGLAVVKKIVDDHRGSIDFESRCGNGTTVRIGLVAGG